MAQTEQEQPLIRGCSCSNCLIHFLRVYIRGKMAQTEQEQPLISDPQERSEGGWGWVVVCASFVCVCVLDGIGYSFGVFLEPLLAESEIGEGRGVLSLAGSMQVSVYGLSSPLVSKLMKRYGERKPCMAGAMVSAIGLIVAR